MYLKEAQGDEQGVMVDLLTNGLFKSGVEPSCLGRRLPAKPLARKLIPVPASTYDGMALRLLTLLLFCHQQTGEQPAKCEPCC
jgi:hypothetical protein